ncbi:hypothetical protein AN214_01241 [Pseudoalteromonas sp. P1-9]|uniref:hypothetical protein n=1 Tax=Pseudoalteromonas sp. P1-9 TaxID=1710354 RepID=UPI0006D60C1D|nr:hypothetical protein [Pseudoalteromonas sp. P1-9]KPV96780.1 hypothetical protein AN214_01241 [Pseudoalteromonas sp. P1-9]
MNKGLLSKVSYGNELDKVSSTKLEVVIVTFAIFVSVVLFCIWKVTENSPNPAEIEYAKKALELMKDTTIWMATAQLTVFAALVSSISFKKIPISFSAIVAIECLIVSLIAATINLTGLTSVYFRLGQLSEVPKHCIDSTLNGVCVIKDKVSSVNYADIYSMPIYDHLEDMYQIPLGFSLSLQQWAFVVSVIALLAVGYKALINHVTSSNIGG